MPISLLPLLARTGSLPPTFDVPPLGMYKTLRAARRAERGPCCLLPEGTTGNGKAVLRFGEGVLAEGDVGGDDEGVVWVKYFRCVLWKNFQAVSVSYVTQPSLPYIFPLSRALLSTRPSQPPSQTPVHAPPLPSLTSCPHTPPLIITLLTVILAFGNTSNCPGWTRGHREGRKWGVARGCWGHTCRDR